MDYTSIGKHIREHRLAKKLHQDQLAEAVGLSPNYLGAIERGEKIPSLETFIAILNKLDLSADQVLADVIPCSYLGRNSMLDEKFKKLSPKDRERIYAVIDTLLQHTDNG